MSVLHGDDSAESFLAEILCPPLAAARHMTVESIYEYGGRAGVWRVLNLFRERQIPLTMFAVGMANGAASRPGRARPRRRPRNRHSRLAVD